MPPPDGLSSARGRFGVWAASSSVELEEAGQAFPVPQAGRLRLLRADADAEPSRRPADAFVQAEQLESGNGGSRDQH